MNPYLRLPIVVGAVALALSTSACGGDDKPAAKPSASTPASAPVAATTQTPEIAAILTKAKAAFEAVPSVHMSGSLDDQGASIKIDVYVQGDNAKGEVTMPLGDKPVKIELVQLDGKTYIKSKGLWELTGGPELAKKVGDRWAVAPTAMADQYSSFLTIKGMAQVLAPEGTITKAEDLTIQGRKVHQLKDESDHILFIAADGLPLPLAVGTTTGGRAAYDYTETTKITPPPNPVDLTKLTPQP